MKSEHEVVQELLAARALRSLDDASDERAGELIGAHLPSCPACRRSLEDFDVVAAELALATPSLRPPGSLDARVRRMVTGRPVRGRIGVGAIAATVVVALGLGAWSAHLTGRVSRAERQQARAAELISAVGVPSSKIVPLAASSETDVSVQVAAVYVPGRTRLYVVGSMPTPHSNRVYQVWLGRSGSFASGGTFVPGPEGFVLVGVTTDGSAYDHVLITEEESRGGDHPSGARMAESDL